MTNGVVYTNSLWQLCRFKKSIIATQCQQQQAAAIANLPDIHIGKMSGKNREGIA